VTAQANLRMKRPAVLAAQATRARALSLTADRVAILSVAAVSILLAVFTWNRWGDIWLDSGYDLVAAAKVSHANAPYIDFDYWYGPFGVMVLGAIYELFGIGVGPSIGLGLVLAVTLIGTGYALARQLVSAAPAAAVAVLVAVPAFSSSNVSYVQPHTFAAPFGMLFDLAAILLALRFAQTGARRWLVAAGVAVGLTALTRPENFVVACLAVGGWLVVRALRAPARRQALGEIGVAAGAGLAVALGGYGAFLIAGQIHGGLTVDALLHENLFPRGPLRESVSVVYDQLAPKTLGSLVSLAGKLVLYGAGVGGLVLAARTLARGGTLRLLVIAALVLAAAGFVAVLLARPDTLRHYLKFVFAWMPAGSVLAAGALGWTAVRGRGGDREWDARAQLELMVALALIGFTYSVYAGFGPYPNPDFPQQSAYAMPVIATFLAWIHFRVVPATGLADAGTLRTLGTAWMVLLAVGCGGLLLHDAHQERFTVHGIDGSMGATATDGPAYQAAVDTIQRETRRSDAILLAPQMTALYVMTGRHDPLAQLSLLPGALETDADQRAAIKAMEDQDLRLAIVDRRPVVRYDHGSFGVEYDRLVGAWLRKNFTHTKTLRGPSAGGAEPRILDVWLRRTL
jgi:hypothetical protein